MIIVSWRLSLEDLKMRSFMDMKKITAHLIISKYIDYYNNQRIQAKTKWMPPVKYKEASIRIIY